MKQLRREPRKAVGLVAGQLHDGSVGTGRGGARTSSTARYLCSTTLSSHSMSRSVRLEASLWAVGTLSRMTGYDDGRVMCTDVALVIRRYYFPPRDKRIPYNAIRQVRRVPLASMGWRVKTYGSADLIHWFNFDPRRWSKPDALIISLAGRVRPVITPDNAGDVMTELSAHGVKIAAG